MGYKSPINAPASYNKIRLVSDADTLFSPGCITDAKLDSRMVEIADQQQPGFAGAVVVQKLEKIWTGEYTYKIWTTTEHEADKAFVALLRAGMKKGAGVTGVLGQGRRARVWRISDPRLQGLDVANVLVEAIGPKVLTGPGKPWLRTIKFHEYKKPVQLPLLKVEPTAADNEVERQIKLQEQENKALAAELSKAQAAQPKGLSDLLPSFLAPS